ncbi:MAG: 5-(carboxyamino)imidazole ribonucleotide synthase [Chlorobiota bacterium]
MLQSKIDNGSLIIGVLGAGQLAKMLANDAYRLGLRFATIEDKPGSPATFMTKFDFSGSGNNRERLDKFVDSCDVITLENEFIDPEILEYIEESKPVYPSSKTLKLIQDKFIQKNTFAEAGLKLPNYNKMDNIEDCKKFGEQFGYPFVLKARKYGYDGYGNETVRSEGEIEKAYNNLTKNNKSGLLAESFVNFTKELAVMVARSKNGETAIYPCVETIQRDHICHQIIAPAEVDNSVAETAQQAALACVKAIDGVGVFGIELFLTEDGEVLVNEIAPRPHNSGHYTIEGCYTSQYENAIRAINGLPLGSTELITGAACMINLLGERDGSGVPSSPDKMLQSKAKLHLYDKADSRVGRKMGHITAVASNTDDAIKIAKKAAADFKW